MQTHRLHAHPATLASTGRTRSMARPYVHPALMVIVVGALLALAPFSGLLAALIRVPALAMLYPLCFVPLAVLLLLSRQRRAVLPLNALTASVVAYALLISLALLLGSRAHLLAGLATTLAPLSLFFIGMSLWPTPARRQTGMSAPPLDGGQHGSPSPRGSEPTPCRAGKQLIELRRRREAERWGQGVRVRPSARLISRPERRVSDAGRQRARIVQAFGWLAIGTALALALLTLVATTVYPIVTTSVATLLPGALALAPFFALALILSLSWDARRRYWLWTLGRATPALCLTLAIGLPFYLLALGGALSLTGSRSTLIAIAVALGGVSLARRRLSEVAILSALALPVLALTPRTPGGWLGATQNATALFFNGAVWSHALSAATQTPLGSGIAGTGNLARPQYLVTLETLGLPGLVALASILAIALFQCWRTYRRLRPTSGEAGAVLAGWGLTLFVVIASMATAPLSEPLPGLFFWFFLGLANATTGAVSARAARNADIERLRGYPLRIGYLIHGDERGDLALTLYEHLCTLDRRRITPLVIALGPGGLATLVRGTQTHTRIVRPSIPAPHKPRMPMEAHRWRLWLNRLAQIPPGSSLYALVRDARSAWDALVEWARITRALLELDLDLLVSTESRLHLPGLFAGRLAGVPVQWRARDIAPPGRQFALDALAAWTDGVLAESQTVARSYHLRVLGPVVRVLRPSIEPPPRPSPERIASLRRMAGVQDGAPLLTVVGPVTPTSGHHDLLEAVTLLSGAYPHLRVVLASESFPGRAATHNTQAARMERLRRAIGLRGLDGMVCCLGPREDVADLLAASDIAVFPQWHETASRGMLLAMAMGTPIIVARSGVFPELLRDAWGCRLVPAHTPGALAEAISDCLEDLPRYHAEAQRNPWLVRDWYAPHVELGRLHSIYRQVCQPEPRPLRSWLPMRRPAAYPRRWWASMWSM